MRTLLSHITRFLQQSVFPRKHFLFVLLCFAGYTYAAGDTNNDADVIDAIVQVMNLIFGILTMLLTPAIIMAGWLLSPDWTMGDFFGLRPYFIQVWVLVSNIVYIIFALMLLYMAVLQIFSSESNYAFKKKLPRFLVGIMMVPFTWLIVSWTLSFANQAVAAVLSIPMGAIANMQDNQTQTPAFHTRVIPTKFTFDFGSESGGGDPKSLSCGDNGMTKDGKTKCISPAEFITYNQSGPFFIILIYAYDIFKVQKTDMANLKTACGGAEEGSVDAQGCIRNLWQLARKFGVSLITTVFFAILLVALCWVLLARAFKLWIYVMFSPLFGLAYAVGEWLGENFKSSDSGGGWHGGGVKLGEVGFVPFFKLAMVPVLVSAVLAFGLLFIGVIKNTFTTGSLEQTTAGTFCTGDAFMVKYCLTQDPNDKEWYSSRLIIGTDTTNAAAQGWSGDYTITFEFGSMLSDFVWNSEGKTVIDGAKGLKDATEDIFAHIILSIIALAIIWMGVKAAVSYDEVTKMAFEPFAKFGDSVGNFVQHIPSYLPTPHPAFKALTPGGMEAMANVLQTKINTEKQESSRTLEEIVKNPSLAWLQGLSDSLQNGSLSIDEFAQKLNEASRDSIIRKKETQQSLLNEIDKIPESAKFTAVKKKELLRDLGRKDISGGEIASIVRENADLLVDASPTIKPLVESAKNLSGSSSWSAPSIGQATVNGADVTFAGSASGLTIKGEKVEGLTKDLAQKIRAQESSGTLSEKASKDLFGVDLEEDKKKALVRESNKPEFK